MGDSEFSLISMPPAFLNNSGEGFRSGRISLGSSGEDGNERWLLPLSSWMGEEMMLPGRLTLVV